jgi:hypothetical protein
LPLIFAVLRSLCELNRSNEVATFRWKLLNWNNRRKVGESGLNRWKVHVRGSCVKIPGSPLERNYEDFDVLILFLLLRWIDQYTIRENRLNGSKVINGRKVFGNSPIAPLKWNLENVVIFPLVELNSLVYCKWESVERVKSYSTGCFGLKSPMGRFSPKKWHLERNFGDFVEILEFILPGCADWAILCDFRTN